MNQEDNVRTVAIGSDHGGYAAKETLKAYLEILGYRVTDVGTHSTDSVDYPDFALKVAWNPSRALL
jgi:ribose 5-phosphate isomerase RpiB